MHSPPYTAIPSTNHPLCLRLDSQSEMIQAFYNQIYAFSRCAWMFSLDTALK